MADALPVTDAELEDVAARLEEASPEEILRWAAARFAPRLGFATGFGIEGCVLVEMIGRSQIELDERRESGGERALPASPVGRGRSPLGIDVFTLDTGLLFPETYGLWGRLEDRYGVTIRGVRPAQSLDAQAAAHGDALWAREPDTCCRLRKVEPLAREAAKLDAWISAIRRDQTPDRATARVVERDARFGIVKINPLVRWTSDDVWRHVRAHEVPYNPLHDRGYPSIGCAPCTSPVAEGEDPRAGRWRGAAKTECGLHNRPLAIRVSA